MTAAVLCLGAGGNNAAYLTGPGPGRHGIGRRVDGSSSLNIEGLGASQLSRGSPG
jgi:hypothetical protein